jgi:hypothetical protein
VSFKLVCMTTTSNRIARPLLIALIVFAAPVLTGCSVAENVVGGVVDEAKNQAGDAISDALGGAGVSTDGELPTGFPSDAVPIVGTVQGGGSAPDASGWVVRTTLAGDDFASAQAALEGAGYVASAVNADSDSGFGTFTLAPYSVALATDTDAEGVVTATYIVTPV